MSRNHDPAPGYTHVWDRRPIGDGTFTIICVPSRSAIMPLGPNEATKIPDPPKPRPTKAPTSRGGGATQKADERKRKDAEARQRPGGPGQKKPCTSTVPEPPKVSAPRITSSISAPAWLKALPVALVALFVLGVLVRHGAAITTAIHNVLTWVPLLAIVAGVAFVAWSTRDADVWQAIPQRFAQRRAAKAELAERHEQARVEPTRAIPIEPIADPAMQEWIERGLRTKHFDDEHFKLIKRRH